LNGNYWCSACFSIFNDALIQGDKGVGVCANSTSSTVGQSLTYFGTIKADTNTSFQWMNGTDNGWESTFSWVYNSALGNAGTFYSKTTTSAAEMFSYDMNKNGSSSKLGFPMKNNQNILCYYGFVSAANVANASLSLTGWDTATALSIDL